MTIPPEVVAFTAIAIALALGYAVTRAAHRPRALSPDLRTLKADIERAERRHAPRKHLRKQMVEAVRKELEKA